MSDDPKDLAFDMWFSEELLKRSLEATAANDKSFKVCASEVFFAGHQSRDAEVAELKARLEAAIRVIMGYSESDGDRNPLTQEQVQALVNMEMLGYEKFKEEPPTLEALKDCNCVQSAIIDNSNGPVVDAEGNVHKVTKFDSDKLKK